jgi:hypothetical protein
MSVETVSLEFDSPGLSSPSGEALRGKEVARRARLGESRSRIQTEIP